MSRAFLTFAIVVLLCLPSSGWGAEPSTRLSATMPSGGLECGLWIGRIGSLPVAAWLQPGKHPDTIDGRYGYLRLGKTTLTILHASGNSVTVYEKAQDDCGVHPEETETLVTFDISGPHAVKLDLESLLNIDESAAKRNRFMRMVLKQREREAGQDGDATDDGCDEAGGYPPSFSFGTVRDGILVDVDYGAHVTEPCDYQVTLPHRDVKRLFSAKAPQWLREGKY